MTHAVEYEVGAEWARAIETVLDRILEVDKTSYDEIVATRIKFSEHDWDDGTLGEISRRRASTVEEARAWLEETPWTEERIEIGLTTDAISNTKRIGVVAHELGHAVTSAALIDQIQEGITEDPEWASEAAADYHCIRWGFEKEIRERGGPPRITGITE